LRLAVALPQVAWPGGWAGGDAGVEAGTGSVMAAYNRVIGSWCGVQADLLDSILQQRWGFKGIVVSDFFFGIHDGVAASLAGLDLELPFPLVFEGCLAAALASGGEDPNAAANRRTVVVLMGGGLNGGSTWRSPISCNSFWNTSGVSRRPCTKTRGGRVG